MTVNIFLRVNISEYSQNCAALAVFDCLCNIVYMATCVPSNYCGQKYEGLAYDFDGS